MKVIKNLISTVGTSLFFPNLASLNESMARGTIAESKRALASAYANKDWGAVAEELCTLPPSDRICGAEINSIDCLRQQGIISAGVNLFFLNSQTPEGAAIADVLKAYYARVSTGPVESREIEDLQDADPRRFRTRGLRQLVSTICSIVQNYGSEFCAINATGGYKAQIAIAVSLGQALNIPVFYKHERFDDIISFPPMPIALDYELWMQASDMLYNLAQNKEPIPYAEYQDEWQEVYESLVNRTPIDGSDYLELSATGEIFHAMFHERFGKRLQNPAGALPDAPKKLEPHLENAGWPGTHPEVQRFMARITKEIGPVSQCRTYYYNPSLPSRTRFVYREEKVHGIFSQQNYTVKFIVNSTATTSEQTSRLIFLLNEWLARRS